LMTVFCLVTSLASQSRTVLSAADVMNVLGSVGCHTPVDVVFGANVRECGQAASFHRLAGVRTLRQCSDVAFRVAHVQQVHVSPRTLRTTNTSKSSKQEVNG
jgi:uncharacterized ParB-like nuclease family protein